MLGQYRLLLPGVRSIRSIHSRLVTNAIATQQGLAAVTPSRNPSAVDDLTFHVKPTDEKGVALVLEILEDGSSVLSHENRVGGVVVDPELVCDAMALANAMERDPRSGGVSKVVMPGIGRRPPRHRTLLDPVNQATRFRFAQ